MINNLAQQLLNMDFTNAHKAKEIYPIVSNIKDMFAQNDYGSVDWYTSSIEFDKMSPTAMVCVISATYPARYKLQYWFDTRDIIYNLLKDRVPDVDNLFRGFY